MLCAKPHSFSFGHLASRWRGMTLSFYHSREFLSEQCMKRQQIGTMWTQSPNFTCVLTNSLHSLQPEADYRRKVHKQSLLLSLATCITSLVWTKIHGLSAAICDPLQGIESTMCQGWSAATGAPKNWHCQRRGYAWYLNRSKSDRNHTFICIYMYSFLVILSRFGNPQWLC